MISRYRTVVTIHDLIHLHFREYRRSPIKGAYVQVMMRRAVASDYVIVPSENTRRDLIELIGAKPDRIVVIPYGLDGSFNQGLPLADCQSVAQRYGLSGRYILYSGAFKPHKNLPTLLRAWQAVKWDGNLAIAGGGSGREEAVHFGLARELGLLGRVVFLGWVPRKDMPALTRAATALVHPSRYEGFGLPVLEAMACGTPVIAANSSSIPEVVGDAALLVEVDSVSELAASIQRMIDSSSLRSELSERGIRRAALFSWERAARATLQLYDQLA
jgi:glycosyltransferase involved in cell wall biosynthesis